MLRSVLPAISEDDVAITDLLASRDGDLDGREVDVVDEPLDGLDEAGFGLSLGGAGLHLAYLGLEESDGVAHRGRVVATPFEEGDVRLELRVQVPRQLTVLGGRVVNYHSLHGVHEGYAPSVGTWGNGLDINRCMVGCTYFNNAYVKYETHINM